MNSSFASNPNFQLLLSVTKQTIQELGYNKTTLQEIIARSRPLQRESSPKLRMIKMCLI